MSAKRLDTARQAADSAYVEALVERLRDNLARARSAYRQGGRSLSDLGDPEALADRMTAAIPLPSPWDEALGPFYRTGQVRRLLGGITRQAIDDRIRRRRLLALRTADGRYVYPSFQFDRRNRLLPGLPEVLQVFADDAVDGWTLAGWLRAGQRDLDGASVIEWLRCGGELAQALELARQAADRFGR